MPNVLKRARTDRFRAITGTAVVYTIAAIEIAVQMVFLRRAHTAFDYFVPFLVCSSMIMVIASLHWAMRRTWGASGGTPAELLTALERRHAGRRKLMRLMPWVTGYVVSGTMAGFLGQSIRTSVLDLRVAGMVLAVCGVTAGFTWLVIRRVGRVVERELREVAEARKLLSEGAD
jgi:hypothetical protein